MNKAALAATVFLGGWAMAAQEWHGQSCGVHKASARVVSNAAEWAALWSSSVNQEAPKVDFSNSVAVAVFLGSRPTGGYAVEFLEPRAEGKERVIRYRVKRPGPGDFVIQAFTAPFAVKVFSKAAAKIRVEEAK